MKMIFINNQIYPIEKTKLPAQIKPHSSRDIQINRDLIETKRPFMGIQYFRSSSGCSACNK